MVRLYSISQDRSEKDSRIMKINTAINRAKRKAIKARALKKAVSLIVSGKVPLKTVLKMNISGTTLRAAAKKSGRGSVGELVFGAKAHKRQFRGFK